jgi:fluoroquinolone transport system permease protein
MWSSLRDSFKADIKFVAHHPRLLMAIIAPFIVVLFLQLIFPPLSGFIFLKTNFLLEKYYSIVAISLISGIPMLLGIVYAFILLDERDQHLLQVRTVTPAGKKNSLYMRMIVSAFLSFILVLFSIILTNPVPTEGWVRTIFVSFLLSTQSLFGFLFIGSLAGNRVEGSALTKLYGIFLVAVPLGLLLHHPWNYFAFFSPFYWIAWAWVTSVPVESIIYAAIAISITFGCMLIFFIHLLKKYTN